MTLHIRPAGEIGQQDLRRLVLENLTVLLGDDARPCESLPELEENCLLVTNGQNELSLLSFDMEDPGRALLKGLALMDQLGSDLAALFMREYRRPSRLMVLTPVAPPGRVIFGRNCPVSWTGFRVLRVNDDLGLMFEPEIGLPAWGMNTSDTLVHEAEGEDHGEEMNEEEKEYFQQL
jgi:hypothetical protein